MLQPLSSAIIVKMFYSDNLRGQRDTRRTSDRTASTHVIEWFQKTHTGLVLSSVSSSLNISVMGVCSKGEGLSPSWCAITLTTGLLITGRLGSLEKYDEKEMIKQVLFFLITKAN